MNFNENIEKVAAFQIATDQPVSLEPTNQPLKETNLRYELMAEENKEYFTAAMQNNLVEVLDALVDQYYILLGTINSHGLQSVFEEAFNRVHENNLSKIGPDGKVLRNPSGKILKPANFKPVDLSDLIIKK